MSFKINNILEYDTFIALDIGAFKIKVLICKIENGEIKILGSSSFRQSKKDIIDGEIADLYSVSKSISKAILRAGKDLEYIPDDIIVGFNSSQMVYDFIGMNYVRENSSSAILMDEIDQIIKNIEYKSLEKIRSKIESRLGIIDSEMKLITTSLVSIYLDGQRVSNPIGFSGKNIKLNLINVFSPISKFDIIKNVIRDINKNLISIVPISISIPKLIEDTVYNFDFNLFIDFGYSKTTIIISNNSEIIGFNTINFGFSLLEEELSKNLNLNYLDTENIIAKTEEFYIKHKNIFDKFFNLLLDSILVSAQDIQKKLYFKNIFLSGGGISEILKNKIKDYLEKNDVGKNINMIDNFAEDESFKDYNVNNIFTTVLSLAKSGREILSIKKDPIAKILRYIIYKYE
ncbi:hypothetical protein KAZ01_00990 [Candidatus Gracilibacteria bacterium]|nr:hypothetical protein [Candidatus Gracilibacteria bacterium]